MSTATSTSRLNGSGVNRPELPAPAAVAPHTKYPDIWAGLSAPFDPAEVKERKQAGRVLSYITARTAMNRLDFVVGPENWWDDYAPGEHSVICRLTIRLPDGTTITKCDAGGYAGMADLGDNDKSGYSDSFKRSAAKFGVARYLYGDGVPDYSTPPPAKIDNGSGHKSGKYASDEAAETLKARYKQYLAKREAKFLDGLTPEGGEIPPELGRYPVNIFGLDGHMAKWCAKVGIIAEESIPEGGIKYAQIGKLTGLGFERDEPGFLREVKRYVDSEEAMTKAKLARKRPDLYPPADGDPDGEPIDPAEFAAAPDPDTWQEGRE